MSYFFYKCLFFIDKIIHFLTKKKILLWFSDFIQKDSYIHFGISSERVGKTGNNRDNRDRDDAQSKHHDVFRSIRVPDIRERYINRHRCKIHLLELIDFEKVRAFLCPHFLLSHR